MFTQYNTHMYDCGCLHARTDMTCSGDLVTTDFYLIITSTRRGLWGIVFTRSVCLSVCLSLCPANILVFYFSAIRRDIDLKFIQDTYSVVWNKIDLHRSNVKVTGTVHCFLKAQSYHKNWAIAKFPFFHRHLLWYSIRWNNKNWREQRNDVTKIRQYLTLICKTHIPKLLILIQLSIKI